MSAFSDYDLVNRNPLKKTNFSINDDFQSRLIKLSFQKIFLFLKDIIPNFKLEISSDECVRNFKKSFLAAKTQNLISYGGIPEKNYLALSIISQLLNPSLYVESGFFKGSSLLAVSDAKNLKHIIGFDPIHSEYKAKLPIDIKLTLLKTDFSKYNFEDENLSSSLVYFDDHINTAERIIQASDKGFKNLIFDDSCGLMGTAERIYPSLPSLFFIDNVNNLIEGDKIEWSKDREKKFNFFNFFSFSFKKKKYFSFKFDKTTIDLCKNARERISSIHKIPDLNDYIYTERQMPNDITQHLVILK